MKKEKTPESPLDCKEIQPVHSEGDQPWMFFGGNDAKTESPGIYPIPSAGPRRSGHPAYGSEHNSLDGKPAVDKFQVET